MERASQLSSGSDSDDEVPSEAKYDVKPPDLPKQENARVSSDRGIEVQRNIGNEHVSRKRTSFVARRYFQILIFVSGTVLAILIASCIRKGSINALGQESKDSLVQDELVRYLMYLRSEYSNQNQRFWNVVGSQIAEYLNHSTSPLTILMVYKDADKTAKLLAKEVSRVAVELKHSTDVCGDIDSLKIDGTASILPEEYLLKEKLPYVTKCKKLLIFDVQNLQPSAAADLHSLLDPDYPNVKGAVYVFTVKIANETDRSLYHTVNNLLTEQWGRELHGDKLEPLLSRLVNFVKVEPEPLIEL